MKVIKVAQPLIGDEEIEAVKKVLLSGQYVSGKKVREFEAAFAAYHGVKYAVAVNSGTAALHTALAVLGVGPGDEVIVPPLTFFSTVTAVLHQYGVPIFADIDPDGYCMDPADVEKKITRKTKAIIPVHLYGGAAEMNEIVGISQKHGLKIIEDCAQAHGTKYRDRKVGSIGDIGAFSFFATKHMTTGEGGMLITDNPEWAEKARMIRSHGMSDRDHHDLMGYNYRMNEIAAAIGIEQLKKLDDFNDKRIANSLYLIEALNKRNIPWLKTPVLKEYIKHTFFWCPLLIHEERLGVTTREWVKRLRDSGVETRNRYWEPLYRQKILLAKDKYPHRINFADNDIDYSKVRLEHAGKIAGRLIGIPNHPGLERKELDKIIDVLSTLK